MQEVGVYEYTQAQPKCRGQGNDHRAVARINEIPYEVDESVHRSHYRSEQSYVRIGLSSSPHGKTSNIRWSGFSLTCPGRLYLLKLEHWTCQRRPYTAADTRA